MDYNSELFFFELIAIIQKRTKYNVKILIFIINKSYLLN